jgi:hypothetical protein
LFQTFSEARLQYDAARRDEARIAAQMLELKVAQRDLIRAAGEIKTALVKIGEVQAAPAPPKATSVATAPKTKPVSKASSKTATKIVSKTTPKRPKRTLAEVEAALAAISQRVAALGSHLSK